MVLYTEQNPDVWTEEANMQGGINFYFATWTSNSGTNQNTLTLPTSQISPHFSIEVGGLEDLRMLKISPCLIRHFN